MKNRPMTRVNLDKAIARIAGNDPRLAIGIRMSMANAIVGQFLPEGVVKGGTSLKYRFGGDHARYTLDLDAAWKTDLDTFLVNLKKNLSKGWEGFTGEVAVRPQASPAAIPFDYVMQPFDVKLFYKGQSWCTVELEVGYNEIGDADKAEFSPIAADIVEMFEKVGLPPPNPLPLMPIEYQIAQKLHGVTSAKANRPHDLIDLQVIVGNGEIDMPKLLCLCRRLFKYRNQQTWPARLELHEEWRAAYNEWRDLVSVRPTLEDAVDWANTCIAAISACE